VLHDVSCLLGCLPELSSDNNQIINDKSLQLKFSKQRLCHFWTRTRNECPVVSDLTIHRLLPFCTTHLFEAALSKLIIILSPKTDPF